MTKLCDTCEYLRFCARSGIEEVGCDRYKKDMTTNEEWFTSLSTEEKAKVMVEVSTRDSLITKRYYEYLLKEIKEWLKQPHTPKE